ncbi:MAG: glycerate kinase type-2 family protein [Promethearchaeota archaeon]
MTARHIVKNRDQLLRETLPPATRGLREIALDLLEIGIRAVDPGALVRAAVSVAGGRLVVREPNPGTEPALGPKLDLEFDLDQFDGVHVLGAGKASGSMAAALESILGDRLVGGKVVVPRQTLEGSNAPAVERVVLLGGDHPVPSEAGVSSAREVFEYAKRLGSRDLAFCVISGGGSALMTLPAPGLGLGDLQETNRMLLASGAPIGEVNAVRKHLSSVKGGRLAAALAPATCVTLVLSDVVGDPLDVIASGPTVPDPTTFADAWGVLERCGLLGTLPPGVTGHLRRGLDGRVPETPKPGDPAFTSSHVVVVGNAHTAARAIVDHATSLGWHAKVFSNRIQGEARDYARTLLETCKTELTGTPAGNNVLVGTGELTVTIRGNGVGGRNQEMLLALVPLLRGCRDFCVASLGMDGIEGNSDAAGALVDGDTPDRAKRLGLNPTTFLEENDSNSFFTRLGDAILTGLTGTNVNDLTIVVSFN